MSSTNLTITGLIEGVFAIFGFHGLGWLAAGFPHQAVVRMLFGWALALSLTSGMALSLTIFGPWGWLLGALAGSLWPLAAAWSTRRLRQQMEQHASAAS